MINKPTYFQGFNFLRFFAAISIVIYHATLSLTKNFDSSFALFFQNLTVGVDLFFLISGFLIVYLLVEEKSNTNSINLFKFYSKRVLRIFPLYYLIVFISYLLYGSEANYKPFLYFWGNFEMANTKTWAVATLTPLWSLCVEEHFYLFIPISVSLLPLRLLKYFLMLIVCFSIGFRLFSFFTVEYSWYIIYLHTLSKIDVIALGGLLALNYKPQSSKIKVPDWLFLTVIVMIVLFMFNVNNFDYSNWSYVGFKKYIIIIPFIFILSMLLYTESRVINAIKSNKFFDYLGKCSFGIYVFHSPVMFILDKYGVHNSVVFLLLTFITTITVSIISYEYFEKVFMKLRPKS